MKVIVFGASGRTGLPIVRRALDAGHQVVAFVRDASKMPITHEHLTVVCGDVRNLADVEQAITSDGDAVISVIGPTKGAPKDLLPAAVDNIVAVMTKQHIRRLIYSTGAGVAMPEDKPQLINHVIKFALKTMAGDVLKQSELSSRKVQDSALDWIIVRFPMLNEQPYSGSYRVGWVGVNTGPRLSRADAADFIVKQLTSDSYIHKAPVISN